MGGSLHSDAPAMCLCAIRSCGGLPGCGALRRSFKLSSSYSIDPFDDRNLRMLAIAEIAPEHTAAAFPAYLIAGTPVRFDAGRRLYRSMALALTCPAGRASGQPCSARHMFAAAYNCGAKSITGSTR
jgi:hypothetical protein